MLVISRSDIRRAVTMSEAIAAAREAFVLLSTGQVDAPLRTSITHPDGTALFMPAFAAPVGVLSLKAVTVNPPNPGRGLPQVQATVLLLDAPTGSPLALLEGTYLTALRTGAAIGLATDLLARPNADTVALFGVGATARTELWAVCTVRTVREVRVVHPHAGHFPAFAAAMRDFLGEHCPALRPVATPAEALRGAQIVIAATSSPRPVFAGEDLELGTHVNASGAFRPDLRELDLATVRRSRLVVDSREAALSEAGDLAIPLQEGQIMPAHVWAELGEVAAGRKSGRQNEAEITLFKSVGNAAQDLTLARLVYQRAVERGLGTTVGMEE